MDRVFRIFMLIVVVVAMLTPCRASVMSSSLINGIAYENQYSCLQETSLIEDSQNEINQYNYQDYDSENDSWVGGASVILIIATGLFTFLLGCIVGGAVFLIIGRHNKKTFKKLKRVSKVFKKQEIRNFINENKIEGASYSDRMVGLIEFLIESEKNKKTQNTTLKELENKYRKLQDENKKLEIDIRAQKEKSDNLLEKNKIDNNNEIQKCNKKISELTKKLQDQSNIATEKKNEYNNKLAEQKERCQKDIERIQHDMQSSSNKTRESLQQQVNEAQFEYKQLTSYLETELSKLRDIDILLSKESIRYKGWDNDGSVNYLIKYLLGLRSLLNIVYCMFSKKDVKCYVVNLQEILHEVLNTEIDFKHFGNGKMDIVYKEDIQLTEKSLLKEIQTSFNKRISPFPSKYQYGLKDDETIN